MSAATEAAACAIIVAGGTGERFGDSRGKQLARVAGSPILSHTLVAFDAARTIGHIVVVCHPDRVEEYARVAVEPISLETPITYAPGGDQRSDSVTRGLAAVPDRFEVCAVHDGARPLVTAQIVDAAVETLLLGGDDLDGVVVGHPAYDTLKEVREDIVTGSPDRSRFWVAQTPQVFRVSTLARAYSHASAAGTRVTDDAGAVEAGGGTIKMLEGPRSNIKVTVAEDVDIVAALIAHRQRGQEA